MNARMPELKRCFEAAGFGNVRTLLSSGNVVFDAKASSEAVLERRIERAMQTGLGRTFHTIVRPVAALQAMRATDPYSEFALPKEAKRVVTFLRIAPKPRPKLPLEKDGARILRLAGREVFTAYVPNARGPVFMVLLERTFGTGVTTRTWDTVGKCAVA